MKKPVIATSFFFEILFTSNSLKQMFNLKIHVQS